MRARGLASLLALPAALAGGPLAAAVVVEGAPPEESRAVQILAEGRPNPCVSWSFLPAATSTLWIVGHPVSPCPESPDQTLELPPLAPGRYTLVARLAETGETWDQVSFAVGLPVAPGATFVDLAPDAPAPLEPVEIVVTSIDFGLNDSIYYLDPPTIEGDRIRFDGTVNFCPITCAPFPPQEFVGRRYVLPGFAAGTKVIEFRIEGFLLTERAFTVAAAPTALQLHDRRFDVRPEWRDRAGEAHEASAETLTAESGRFWFFRRENAELTVKILDGRALNGSFWLFAASMTDLAYELTVIDHDTGNCGPSEPCPRVKTYRSPAGSNGNVIDTSLFRLIPPS